MAFHSNTLLLTGFAIGLTLSSPCLAQHDEPTKIPQSTRIKVDEENDVIRFYIKGEPAALLDENGLHVVNDLNYGGSMADQGSEHVAGKIKAADQVAGGEDE